MPRTENTFYDLHERAWERVVQCTVLWLLPRHWNERRTDDCSVFFGCQERDLLLPLLLHSLWAVPRSVRIFSPVTRLHIRQRIVVSVLGILRNHYPVFECFALSNFIAELDRAGNASSIVFWSNSRFDPLRTVRSSISLNAGNSCGREREEERKISTASMTRV